MNNEIVLYSPNELTEHIEVRIDEETVWLTQQQMATLFEQTKQNISLHINNCFREKELDKISTVKKSLTVQKEWNNSNFNYGEFATIRNKSGLNSFKISVKEFAAKTNAISLQAKAGRYGGTYAHKDIALEFAMWISPEFKIYMVLEFQRLKEEEQKQLGWSAKRELAM